MNPPSKDNVTRVLSKDAFSLSLPGLGRADGAQLGANNPCEDRLNRAHSISLWEGEKWIAATVFDGHVGWQNADHLEKNLINAVRAKLEELQSGSRTDDKIQGAIERAFVDLDSALINDFISRATDKAVPLETKVQYMEVAWSGSCALMVLYNPATRTLYTACTGDSRAILGQQNPDTLWEAEALSEDQNCANEAEIARINREHPNEDIAVHNGRILGLAVCRAFGDFRWKSSYEMQLEFSKRFMSCPPNEKREILTPPYLIATPVVTVQKLTSELPSFVVLATDGLWYNCENYEVGDLVVQWLEAQPAASIKAMGLEPLEMTADTVSWKKEPLQAPTYDPGFDFLERWDKLFDVRFLSSKTTIQDDNVAVHLMRNALGGNHRELLAGNVAIRAPYARDVRDDITIQVLFFPGVRSEQSE
ncbi:hypothetical protein LLEC1_07195 [Akanthomyces lecanii]|uniref:PPM-type phosphatase domain-containing protein n=1 Tax=Cordyceps confragosa TaxID=2714763 RepID=A0A179IA90_CORDF|nr:hypothetical protein LLEC1_07195 [Akanthomyces lecanii]